MSTILCFGEILWDCLPHRLFLGGIPLNVAYHLKRLGHKPLMRFHCLSRLRPPCARSEQ